MLSLRKFGEKIDLAYILCINTRPLCIDRNKMQRRGMPNERGVVETI
jgi:hypothetical protein